MDLSQNTASTSSSSLIWGTAVPGKRKGSTRGHGIFHRDVGTLEIDLSSDDSQPSANDDEVDSFEDQTEPSSIDSASSEGSTRQDQDSESDPWEGQREKSRSNGTVGSNSRQVQKSSKSNTTTGDHAGQLRHPKRPKRAAEPAAAVRHLGFQQTAVSRATLSIAGSRPEHWGAPREPTKKPQERLLVFTESQKSVVRKELDRSIASRVAAMKPPLSHKRPSPPHESAPVAKFPSDNALNDPASKVAISFAPAFLSNIHSRKGTPEATNTEEVETLEAVFDPNALCPTQTSAQTPGSPSFHSPLPSKFSRKRGGGGRAKEGPLVKRLKQIRDTINGDAVRFRSGQYPFRSRDNPTSTALIFDMNDPRRRSKSLMDITVVGQSYTWPRENQRLTFLAFVNSHMCVSASNSRMEPTTDEPADCLAWISFSVERATEQGIRPGLSFRIYDPIAFSLSQEAVAAVDTSRGWPAPQWMILAQLCESYPKGLPALPDITAVADRIKTKGQS